MQDTDTQDLLTATGCLIDGHVVTGDAHISRAIGMMDPLANPTVVSELARRLADALLAPAPDLIVAWPGLDNVVLAFATGVAMDRPVSLLSDAEGLVTASGNVQAGQSVALVGVTLSSRDANLARAFVESRGSNLDVTASLVGTGEVAGELSLVSLQDHTYSESDCPVCGEGVTAGLT